MYINDLFTRGIEWTYNATRPMNSKLQRYMPRILALLLVLVLIHVFVIRLGLLPHGHQCSDERHH